MIPKTDRALNLRLDRIGIDHGAAVDRTDNASDTNIASRRHLDFSNHCQIGREYELDGDATANSFRQRLSPAGLLRGKLENSFCAGRFVEKSLPIGDRILLRGCRQLVHEAFGHEDIV